MIPNQTSLDVLFINSPLFREENLSKDEDCLPPLGLGYIATHAQKYGLKVELLDAVANNISIRNILDFIKSKSPNFIAINIFTTNLPLVKDIIEALNENNHCIIGGLATKSLYQQIFTWSTKCSIDIVMGDGDYIVTAIVKGKHIKAFKLYKNIEYLK